MCSLDLLAGLLHVNMYGGNCNDLSTIASVATQDNLSEALRAWCVHVCTARVATELSLAS